MNEINYDFGDILNRIVCAERGLMFDQGELAQLTLGAFDLAVKSAESDENVEFVVKFPVGYHSSGVAMKTNRTYSKDQFLDRYKYLAEHLLAVNGVFHLVSRVETMFLKVMREVIIKYPRKIGAKRTLTVESILEAVSIEELHLKATDLLLNELSYKTPKEFAESLNQLVGVDLLQCPAFAPYIEVKAARDIYIHNEGVANDIYARKSGVNSRAAVGTKIPFDNKYFLHSYEYCLQIADWFEESLHKLWPSARYDAAHIERQLKAPLVSTGNGHSD